MNFGFDLDGVIANIDHRLPLITDGAHDWDRFFSNEEIQKDLPVIPTRLMMHALYSNRHRIIIISGRSKRTEAATQAWLYSCGFLYHDLILRPDGDHSYRDASEWKVTILLEQAIHVLFDDSMANVLAARKAGVEGILYAAQAPRLIPHGI